MQLFILLLALAATATPAVAADQFDLVCKGRSHPRQFAKWKSYEVRYRIDLTQEAWCAGDCTTVKKIVEVAPGELTLDRSDPADRLNIFSRHQVDRQTGKFRQYMSGGLGLFFEAEGKCESVPFTGFPPAKF